MKPSIGAGQRCLLAMKRSCRFRTIEWPLMHIAVAQDIDVEGLGSVSSSLRPPLERHCPR